MSSLAALLLISTLFWGPPGPACGKPTIQSAQLQDRVVDLTDRVVGLADLGTCTITLDSADLRGAGVACMAAIHEYKHLLGYYDPVGFVWPNGWVDHSHSPDPDSVMYPVMRSVRSPCRW